MDIGNIHPVYGFNSLKQLLNWYLGDRAVVGNRRASPLLITRNNDDYNGIEKIFSNSDGFLARKEMHFNENRKKALEHGIKLNYIYTEKTPTYKDYWIDKHNYWKKQIKKFLENKEIRYYAICQTEFLASNSGP